MKPESEANEPEAPVDEAASPPDDSPESEKERELDELRRFKVRTVPPDMRRQWMLAETPLVSTLELQDTAPPNQIPEGAMSEPTPGPPRPLYNAPRVSSTAKTQKLPRVVVRQMRSTNRMLWIVVAALAAVLAALVWRSSEAPPQATVPVPPSEPAVAPHVEPAAAEPRIVPETRASATPAAIELSAALGPHTTKPAPARSAKIPPPEKPKPESDIKTPLFGQ